MWWSCFRSFRDWSSVKTTDKKNTFMLSLAGIWRSVLLIRVLARATNQNMIRNSPLLEVVRMEAEN